MKIAAKMLVVVAILASVMTLSVGTSSAATEKFDGYCTAGGEPVVYNSGSLRHKYNNSGKHQFDLRCRGEIDLGGYQGVDKGYIAHLLCYFVGFHSYAYDANYEYLPGEITRAYIKLNSNGKFDLKCRTEAYLNGTL